MFRAVPSVRNVTLVEFLMADGRETTANLQHQALGAVHQHTQNTIEPTQKQLDAIGTRDAARLEHLPVPPATR